MSMTRLKNVVCPKFLLSHVNGKMQIHNPSHTQVPLLAMLEEYNVSRQEKEEEKQRQRVSFVIRMHWKAHMIT